MILKKRNLKSIFISILLSTLFLIIHTLGLIRSTFIGDFGFYFLQARDIALGHNFPLVGIPSSVPVLKQGAIWSYVLALALYIGNFNPIAGVILSILLGAVGVGLTYFLITKMFSQKVAIIATFITSTFPFIVMMDRKPYHTSVIFPLTVVFAWLVYSIHKKATLKHIFLLGLVWGLLFQSELAAIIFIPIVILVYLIKQFKFTLKRLLSFSAGAFWGILPFFIYDFREGVFVQTIGFSIWFFSKVYEVGAPILFLLFLILIWKKQFLVLRKVSFETLFILIWGVIGVMSFWLRGTFSDAYIPLIYFPIVTIAALLFSKFIDFNKKLGTRILILFIFLSIVNSVIGIISITGSYVSLDKQMKVAEFISNDLEDKEIQLVYIGPNMQFEAGDDHLEYHLWYQGVSLNSEASQKYAIIYEPHKIPDGFLEKANFGGIRVAKKK